MKCAFTHTTRPSVASELKTVRSGELCNTCASAWSPPSFHSRWSRTRLWKQPQNRLSNFWKHAFDAVAKNFVSNAYKRSVVNLINAANMQLKNYRTRSNFTFNRPQVLGLRTTKSPHSSSTRVVEETIKQVVFLSGAPGHGNRYWWIRTALAVHYHKG